ncbi:MAG: methylated-DNA--[protein]-cysteine S-methyltransferase [Gammaproteobacteria bacterium]|nr:methylated-DNA--[protein]-cysteine S-methyltransferase [Gammaproteobacteria bacterium]
MDTFIVASPVGKIEFGISNNQIHSVNLYSRKRPCLPDSELEMAIENQVNDYFSGARNFFNLPVKWETTDFRKKICQALKYIPYGKTITYGELAKQLASSPRAVGGACRNNPLPLLFPCHRVVAASGLGGFSGETSGHRIEVKKFLLNLECSSRDSDN